MTTSLKINSWHSPPLALPELKKNAIHLWRVNLDEQQHTTALLSLDEKKRAAQFKFPIHQQRFTGARSILRRILGRYLNQAPETLIFEYTANGKPYLANHPLIHFNLSHSNEWALYAIGLEEKIGVDIEHIQEDTETTAIAQRFFSSYENQQLDQLSTDEKSAAFFRTWTCKEAFIKAIGEGLSFPLKNFDIDITENIPRLIAINGDKKAAQQWSLIQLALTENYVGALAIKDKIEQFTLWNFYAEN